MPTPELGEEVRLLFEHRYSTSSKSSIAAALVHWDAVRSRYLWSPIIQTGDPTRGAKLSVFVLFLMGHPALYPSSTISNYVWALCAHMQLNLQADPRVNVIGWSFFMMSVNVLCYMPTEPRRRVPTQLIRDSLAAVDHTDFAQVQMAVLVLFLFFTFQRSELPCPKTYNGLDRLKHLFVKHMQPFEGGFRWAVGTTKADPRAERLSGDAGPGREWIVVGEVDDEFFDLRVWLGRFYSMLPSGPRDPDSPFFVAHDKVRPLIYSVALTDFRLFLSNGGCEDATIYGLHGIRSEAFITCSGAVGEEAAVIQGGWSTATSASRYDRLTMSVARTMASKMVDFHFSTSPPPPPADSDFLTETAPGEAQTEEALRSDGGPGVVAARAAARQSRTSPAASSTRRRQHAPLPPGWRRVERAPTSSRPAGYAIFEGPDGERARSAAAARRLHVSRSSRHVQVAVAPAPAMPPGATSFPDNLEDHVVYHERASSRPPPRHRS